MNSFLSVNVGSRQWVICMSGHVSSKLPDYEFCSIWVSFLTFNRMFLHCMHVHYSIYGLTAHKLPRGQDHARSPLLGQFSGHVEDLFSNYYSFIDLVDKYKRYFGLLLLWVVSIRHSISIRLEHWRIQGGQSGHGPTQKPERGPTYLLAPQNTSKNHKCGAFGMTIHNYAGGSRGDLGPCP